MGDDYRRGRCGCCRWIRVSWQSSPEREMDEVERGCSLVGHTDRVYVRRDQVFGRMGRDVERTGRSRGLTRVRKVDSLLLRFLLDYRIERNGSDLDPGPSRKIFS